MALILHIETSTPKCSVTVARDGEILSTEFGEETNDHIAQLTLLIAKSVQRAGTSLAHLDAVAVSAGPGSYTGLRIGVSTAKGICHALNKKLIAISTLMAMTEGAKKLINVKSVSYCPLVDARRMEVYTMVTDENGKILLPPQAMIIDAGSFSEYRNTPLVFFGSGIEKCRQILNSSHYSFIDAFSQTSENMVLLSLQAYVSGHFADLAYFEPAYIKPVYTLIK